MSVTSNQLLSKVKQDIAEVTAEQVQKQLGAGAEIHLVDVREREEVDGYIAGAALIPRGFLELNIEEDVTMDRSAEIVLYCAGATARHSLPEIWPLWAMRMKSMIGGFKGWKDAGYQFEQEGCCRKMTCSATPVILSCPRSAKGSAKLLKGRVLLVGAGGLDAQRRSIWPQQALDKSVWLMLM